MWAFGLPLEVESKVTNSYFSQDENVSVQPNVKPNTIV